jgi:hypothetical protein
MEFRSAFFWIASRYAALALAMTAVLDSGSCDFVQNGNSLRSLRLIFGF